MTMKGRLLREVGVVSWAPLGVLALLFVLGSPSIASTPVAPAILTHHAPILIEGDNNFTELNGVTDGTGGAADPYVIEGWLIDATSSNGITIRQTRAHLVIRNLTIEGNDISYAGRGILLDGANNTVVDNNTITWSGTYGLLVVASSSNLSLADNDISSNGWVGASFEGATDGSIVRNRFSGNGHTIPGRGSGLSLASSVRFQVDHNDFLSNEFQANDTQPGLNAWHAGYPRGGNHWSDYTGVDQCGGPAQNLCQGPDGFGGTPHLINAPGQDPYPLMHPALDASPPTLRQVLATDGYVRQSLAVSAVVTGPSGVTYVALWLQGIGLDHFDAVPMRPQGGDVYRADIPP